MRTDEFDIERMLINDRNTIEIDLEFKKNLKEHIIAQGKEKGNNVVRLDKSNRRGSQRRYFKIASSFIIAAFVGGTFFSKAIGDHKINFGTNKDNDSVMRVGEVIKVANLISNKGEGEVEGEKDATSNSLEMAVNEENNSSEVKTNLSDEGELDDVKANDTTNNESKENQVDQNNSDIAKNLTGENTKTNSDTNKSENHTLAINNDKPSSDLQTNKGEISNTSNASKGDNDKFDDSKINDLLANENKNLASAPIGKEQNFDTPQIDDIKTSSDGQKLNCYDSRYSSDGSKLLINKSNSIYIKNVNDGESTLVMQVSEANQSFEKPNFMPNGNILYAKAIVNDAKSISHTIYIYDINKKVEKKLVDGLNPMISKDGSKLAYEFQGEVYIRNMATGESSVVDKGRFPSWSYNGKFLSYVKEQTEKVAYDESTEKKDLYVEKRYSTMWIYNFNDKNKYRITNKEFVSENSKIEQWANEVILGKTNHNFDMLGKYTYFESMWAENNKEIYVIRRDNERNMYEFIKFTLD